MTNEHALQQWARETLKVTGPVEVVRAGQIVARKRKLNVIAPQALCEQCNGVWLGRMEDEFKALMGPALNGLGPIYLNAAEQEFAALWVIKSALLLELAVRFTDPGHFCPIPSSALHWLYLHKTPPPRSAVWIGATGPQEGEQPRASYFSNQPVAQAERDWLVGNVITLVYGNLLLKTLVVEVPKSEPYPAAINVPDIPAFAQIWPIRRERVGWPPAGVTYSDLDSAALMMWPIPFRPRQDIPPVMPKEPPEGFE